MIMAMIFFLMIVGVITFTGDSVFHIFLLPIALAIWNEYDKLEDRVSYLELKIKNRGNNDE
jgi:hypothetical protein